MTYRARAEELSSFELYGTRNDDGTILLGHTGDPVPVPGFPPQVELAGRMWELELIRQNGVDDLGNIEPWLWETAQDDPRRRICWGVYV